MTGPIDPDATRAYGAPTSSGGDVTQPVGPRGPAGGGPEEPGFYDDERRPWWIYAGAALVAGVLVGGLIALVVGGGDDTPRTARTTTTTTSSTSTTTTAPTTLPPTAPPTTAAQAPGQVTGLSAGPGGGSGEVSLTWNPVSGAVSYRIYRSSTMGTSGSLIATVNTTSYVDMPGGGAWYYQVSAVSSAGLEGQRSAEACGAAVGSSC